MVPKSIFCKNMQTADPVFLDCILPVSQIVDRDIQENDIAVRSEMIFYALCFAE